MLFLSRQDPGSVDDVDAVQDWVGQLGTHEPVEESFEEGIAKGGDLVEGVPWVDYECVAEHHALGITMTE